MQAIVINETRVSTTKTANKMVERGRCEVCEKPIMVASWVAKHLDKMGRKVTTCSRACSNKKRGVEELDLDEAEGE